MDADGVVQWSDELLALLSRNAPRLAVVHQQRGGTDVRAHADKDALRRSLAAAALDARLRVGLATRARAGPPVLRQAPVVAVSPPPSSSPASNLRLVVNHEWGLAARARARASARRRRLLVVTSKENDKLPVDEHFAASLPREDEAERLVASAEERGGGDVGTPASSGLDNASDDCLSEPARNCWSERDPGAASYVLEDQCSTGSVSSEDSVSGMSGTALENSADSSLQPDFLAEPVPALLSAVHEDAEPQRPGFADPDEPSAAVVSARQPQVFLKYDARQMLLSRLRMQQRGVRGTGSCPLLGTTAAPKRLLNVDSPAVSCETGDGISGSDSDTVAGPTHSEAAQVHDADLPLEPASAKPVLLLSSETCEAAAAAASPAFEHAVPASRLESRPPVLTAEAAEPTVDACFAAQFVTDILQLLVTEQQHGRLLNVGMELPLQLLEEYAADGERVGSSHQLLFDCMNEALLLLTLGAEEVTTSLWQYRMAHLTEASSFDAVSRALNRQLIAWLACAFTDDPRERVQRQLKCNTAAGECAWAASVNRHVAELQAAAEAD